MEIEQLFLSHGSVLEADVTPVRSASGKELLNVRIVLKDGYIPSDELKHELAWFVQSELESAPPFKSIRISILASESLTFCGYL